MTNNTKLLELLYTAKNLGYNVIDVEKLENALIENIREENAKKKGSKSQLTIIKGIEKYCEKCNIKLSGYHPYNGKYAFIDGHRVIVAAENFDYKEAESTFTIEKLAENRNFYTDKIEIDIDDLKTHIALNKANKTEKPYIFTINNVKCGINAKYALDAINFTGSNIFYTSIKTNYTHKCNITPYFQFYDNGDLFTATLPINIQ